MSEQKLPFLKRSLITANNKLIDIYNRHSNNLEKSEKIKMSLENQARDLLAAVPRVEQAAQVFKELWEKTAERAEAMKYLANDMEQASKAVLLYKKNFIKLGVEVEKYMSSIDKTNTDGGKIE